MTKNQKLHQLEEDYNAINETVQKGKQLIGAVSKFVRQISGTHKQNMETIKDIITCLIEQCEKMEQQHQALSEKLAAELGNYINNLQEKFTAELENNAKK